MSSRKSKAAINSGPPQTSMPGRGLKALPAPKKKLVVGPTFTTDHIVQRFLMQFPFQDSTKQTPHPLANLIGWQYLMGGRENSKRKENRAACLEYAFDVQRGNEKEEFLNLRKATPAAAVTNYWDLYEDFVLPSGNNLRAWQTDLLEHVLRINIVHKDKFKDIEPLTVFKHRELFRCLARNCMHTSDENFEATLGLLNEAYDKAGGDKDPNLSLKTAINLWIKSYGLLPKREDLYDEKLTRFCLRPAIEGKGHTHVYGSVLDYCSRAITGFAKAYVAQVKIPTGPSGVYGRAGSTRNFEWFPFWGLVGLAPPRLDDLQTKVKLAKDSFFGDNNCKKIWAGETRFGRQFVEEKQLLQLAFIYSGFDEMNGMWKMREWAVKRERMLRDEDGGFRCAYNMAGTHTTFVHSEVVPWRLATKSSVGDFPPDSTLMENANYEVVKQILKSMDGAEVEVTALAVAEPGGRMIPAPKEKGGARKRGREEEGAQQVAISRAKVSQQRPDDSYWSRQRGEPYWPPIQYETIAPTKRAKITPGERYMDMEARGTTEIYQEHWGNSALVYVGFGLLLMAALIGSGAA